MKKMAAAAVAAAMALALALAGCGGKADEQAGEQEAESAGTEAATGAEDAGEAGESTSEEGTAADAVNPWTEEESAQAAAEAAGLDMMSVPTGDELDLGGKADVSYSAMEGVAEVVYEYPASRIIIRKGAHMLEGDISGDYTVYALEWTQNIKGLEIQCFGNREDAAIKALWTLDGVDFAILAQGLGGDTDFGLSSEQLASLINALQ